MVAVAVAQFNATEDKAGNLKQITDLVDRAVSRGAHVVVLPEYAGFTAPRMDERFVRSAEPIDGPFVTALLGKAQESGAYLVAGFNEAIPGSERVHNTLIAAAPDGSIAATYRKLHLYDAFGYAESDHIQPGDIEAPETFTVGGHTFGLQTCYDLRFPEVTRRIVDAGADTLLLPAEWVPGPLKENHWTTLVRARAIENTVFVAAADQSAPTGAGNSMIVDPMGVVLASLGESVDTAVAELSTERLTEVRTKNPALLLRRFSVTPAE
ncbi:carbon-nitrogen hydrolase family protein [Sciscionella sediminilitoris]|uniref:carbon-nitrogen hydrolase family protein n=1 Tax=Sciscionella sediminilitoris TaxID=1445613 RepID=UPI0004DF2F00|nr:carbon-nitrogen hydrolase family protein [Sciscionella sp. SE31]